MNRLDVLADLHPRLALLAAFGILLCSACSNPRDISRSTQPKSNAAMTAARSPAQLLVSYGVEPIDGQKIVMSAGLHSLYARCSEHVTALEWDFGGGGIVRKSRHLAVDVNWKKLGRFTGTVRGDTATGPVEITFEYELIGEGITPEVATPSLPSAGAADLKSWTMLPLSFADSIQTAPVGIVVDGKPVIAATSSSGDTPDSHLLIAIAATPLPRGPEDWHLCRLKSESQCAPKFLTVRNGLLQLWSTGGGEYSEWASARSKLPAGSEDWISRAFMIPSPSDFGFLGELPVIAIRGGVVGIGLSAEPQRDKDWNFISFPEVFPREPSPHSIGSSHMDEGFAWNQILPSQKPAALFVIDNHLLIPYESYDGLTLAIARTSVPSGSSDFAHYVLPPYESEFRFHGFVLGNRLCLLTTRPLAKAAVPGGLYSVPPSWYRATTSLPQTAVDWEMGPVKPATGRVVPVEVASAIDSRPVVISRLGSHSLAVLMRGTSKNSLATETWEVRTFQGNFRDGLGSAALLDTAAGLAILLHQFDESGPVLVYPDLSAPN